MSGRAAEADSREQHPIVEIAEFTDPFCSWAWGTEPKLRRLKLALGGQANWRTVIGILYDGPRGGEADPASIVAQYERWGEVMPHTGAPTPARLERVAGSSRPAAAAVKAAELQGAAIAELVLRRLRESLFIDGRPAEDARELAHVLGSIPGLDVDALLAAVGSIEVLEAVERDWEETRSPVSEVIGLTSPLPHPGAAAPDGDRLRYRFPTLIATGASGRAVVPGWRPYEAYKAAVLRVAPGLRLVDAPQSPDGVLDEFELVTDVDLAELAGSTSAPRGATRLVTRTGAAWARMDSRSAEQR